mmetsp:Transcript_66920/g.118864  ORF Transcript_66920/g.118864 Transcript_66920/m.118864 type:complete len:626 (-) Transcript_66920:641-2518(-)
MESSRGGKSDVDMESLSFVFADRATVPGWLGMDVQFEVIRHILEVKPDKIMLLCDQGAWNHHASYFEPLQGGVRASSGETGGANDPEDMPEVVKHMLPEGDACKSWDNLSALMRWAFDSGATKKSIVVAFGGGALLNVAGLFASILYRGTKLIYVPTTLLAMHDVVTSLKTSICYDGRKNNIGSFYAPLKILVDVAFCRTLPRKELFSGLGELAKNAALLGGKHAEGFVEALSKDSVDAEHGGSGSEFVMSDATLLKLVRLGIEAKMSILLLDAHEKTSGMIFEYGHTVSHAIEKAYGDGVIPHGLGVTYGMLSSSYAAEKQGIMCAEERKKHDALCWLLLKRWPLPEPRPSAEKVMSLAMRDSKRGICAESEDEIADVLLYKMGDIVPTKTQMLSKFPSNLIFKWLYSMGFPAESGVKTTSQHKVVTNDECKALIDTIRTTSDSDLIGMGFEPLTVGFANFVWAIEKYCQPMVLKRYTELAFFARRARSYRGGRRCRRRGIHWAACAVLKPTGFGYGAPLRADLAGERHAQGRHRLAGGCGQHAGQPAQAACPCSLRRRANALANRRQDAGRGITETRAVATEDALHGGSASGDYCHQGCSGSTRAKDHTVPWRFQAQQCRQAV